MHTLAGETSSTLILSAGSIAEQVPDYFGIISLVVGGVITIAGGIVTAKSQVVGKRIEQSGPQWDAFVTQMKEQQAKHIDYLEKRQKEALQALEEQHKEDIELLEKKSKLDIEEIQRKITILEDESAEIKSRLTSIQKKYEQAISLLRDIFSSGKISRDDIHIPTDIMTDITIIK